MRVRIFVTSANGFDLVSFAGPKVDRELIDEATVPEQESREYKFSLMPLLCSFRNLDALLPQSDVRFVEKIARVGQERVFRDFTFDGPVNLAYVALGVGSKVVPQRLAHFLNPGRGFQIPFQSPLATIEVVSENFQPRERVV